MQRKHGWEEMDTVSDGGKERRGYYVRERVMERPGSVGELGKLGDGGESFFKRLTGESHIRNVVEKRRQGSSNFHFAAAAEQVKEHKGKRERYESFHGWAGQ